VEKEDKILFIRGIMGVIAGVISYFLIPNAILALVVPLIMYAVSIVFILITRTAEYTKWDIFGRGLLTLFLAWFLIFVILYNM
jgi:VIT1/CCC1 family predicted Fe2+/Mn2+ transporter